MSSVRTRYPAQEKLIRSGLSATTTDITNNSWQNGLSATNADFASVDTSLLKSKRNSDGSLPDLGPFESVE